MKNKLFFCLCFLGFVMSAKAQETIEELNKATEEAIKSKDVEKAVATNVKALALIEKELGTAHQSYALALRYKGICEEGQGKLVEAEATFKESASIFAKALGETHSECFFVLQSLGKLYQKQKRFVEAEPVFENCANILVVNLGEDHPYHASFLNELAYVYEQNKKYGPAKNAYEKASGIFKIKSGIESNNYLITRFNLAVLCEKTGEWKEAEIILNDILANTKPENPNYKLFADKLQAVQLHTKEGLDKEDFLLKTLEKEKSLYLQSPTISYLKALMNVAAYYIKGENYVEGLKYNTELVALSKKDLGESNADYITFLHNQAFVKERLQLFNEAELLYLEVLDKTKTNLGDKHPQYLTFLTNLAHLYKQMEQFEKAIPLYGKILEIRKTSKGIDSPEYASALENIAMIYMDAGKFSKADSLLQNVLEIKTKLYKETNPLFLYTLSNLATLYQTVGRFAEAEKTLLKMIEIDKSILSEENKKNYISNLLRLGNLYQDEGRFEESEKAYQEIFRMLGNEKNQTYLITLSSLADVYLQKGLYGKAELMLLEVINGYKSTYGTRQHNYAIALNSMGYLCMDLGKYEEAGKYLQESLLIKEELIGKKHKSYATSLSNLADVKYFQDKYVEAESLYKEALDIYETTVGKESPLRLNAINGLATLYGTNDQPQKAIDLLNPIVVDNQKSIGTENPTYAIYLSNLAVNYNQTNNFVKAEELYLKALEIQERVVGKKHSSYVKTLQNLAICYFKNGNMDKAEEFFLSANQLFLNQIDYIFPYLNEKEKINFSDELEKNFNAFYDFAIKRVAGNPGITKDLYNLRLSNKAILLNSFNKIRTRILKSNDDELIKIYQQWLSQKEFLAKVYQFSEKERIEQGLKIEELERENSDLEKKISLQSSFFSEETETEGIDWEAVKAKLKPNEAAIEMIRFAELKKDGSDSIRYAALIITTTSTQPELVLLRNGDDLEGKYLRNYRNSIAKKLTDNISYNKFWKDIQTVLNKYAGINKIYFSTDGVYNQLNMNTLFDSETQKYLIDEIEIHQVNNTKNILNFGSNKIPDKKAILLGRPAYDLDKQQQQTLAEKYNRAISDNQDLGGDLRFFSNMTFSDLPGTEKEITGISNTLLKDKRWEVKTYLKEEALEEVIKNMQNPAILHIATHGFFIPTEKEINETQSVVKKNNSFNSPMLRSGIILAGVSNYAGTNQGNTLEDGVLTAYEASLLELDKTDLVVLSACETGLGEIRNGEGVYGLQRAFQIAGTKTILMSLWKVSDEATQLLMSSFYEEWLETGDKRKAFHETQIKLREKFKEPYYWGAFVMIGE